MAKLLLKSEDLPPEFWLARSAQRLERLRNLNAPTIIMEREKQILLKRVAALPTYCEGKTLDDLGLEP